MYAWWGEVADNSLKPINKENTPRVSLKGDISITINYCVYATGKFNSLIEVKWWVGDVNEIYRQR